MNEAPAPQKEKLPAAVVAEAAAWLAVLHGPERTQEVERGFHKWLQSHADHPRAFEEVTEIWEDSRNFSRPVRHARKLGARRARRFGLAAAALVLVAIGSLLFLARHEGIGTAVGEQRTLALEDGTQIVLNTATRVLVSYDERVRTVELISGEALFEVARHPDWPFVVIAGQRRIRALGTAFVVRHEQHSIAVTLVHGKVAVTPFAADLEQPAAPKETGRSSPAAEAVVLAPGQRLTFDPAGQMQLDSPQLDAALAWQRREIALDDVPLTQAVAEVNRYTMKPVVLEQPQAADVHVSGLFRIGDVLSFARAVAIAYGLEVIEQDDRILLRGLPHSQVRDGDERV